MTGKVDRDYQLELLQQAKEANVIVYLETGTGKTRIAALLIKHFLNTVDELARPDDDSQTAEISKNVIFLVPTAILVAQQAVQVDDVVNGKQKAGMYNGEKGVDAWDRARWAKEFQEHPVAVMTPAVLVDCLRRRDIVMGSIALLIFDEAHHCNKRHFYNQVMDYYRQACTSERPRIFGMTACPVNTKISQGNPDAARVAVRQAVRELEVNLDATVVTVDDLQHVRQYVGEADSTNAYYLVPQLDRQHTLKYALTRMLWTQVRLTAVRWNVALAKKRKELNAHEQGNGLSGAGERLLAFDDMGGISRADNVGAWLSNCFSYALFVQGPYCAALLLEEYLHNVSGDGTLQDLGAIAPQKEFYAKHKGRRPGDGSAFEQLGTNLAKEREALDKDQSKLNEWVQNNGVDERDVQHPRHALRESLLHAVLILVHVLVPDPCVAHELQTQATELMQPDNTTDDYNPSTRALGHIVGAAVAAVPQAVLEAHVCSTVCRDSVRHVEQWTAVMGCGLLTEKVQRTFHQLLECKEHARTSLVEALKDSPGKAARQKSQRWAALVFTKRQACAYALHQLMRRLPSLSPFFASACLKGSSSILGNSNPSEVLTEFRNGKLNVLFTTAVAEEGLDVQSCSLVVCYDVPVRPLSQVQTMGRARAQQARVVFMRAEVAPGTRSQAAEKEASKYIEEVRQMITVQDALAEPEVPAEPQEAEPRVMLPGSNDSVGITACKQALNRYRQTAIVWRIKQQCGPTASAPSNQQGSTIKLNAGIGSIDASDLVPRYSTAKTEDGAMGCVYQVTVHLPGGWAVMGEQATSRQRAQESAEGKAVQKLVAAGELTHQLQPRLTSRIHALEDEARKADPDWHLRLQGLSTIDQSIWDAMLTLSPPPRLEVVQHTPRCLLADAPPDTNDTRGHRSAPAANESSSASDNSTVRGTLSVQSISTTSSEGPLLTHWLYSFAITTQPAEGQSHADSRAASGAASIANSVGILVKQELPDLEAFDIWPEAVEGNGQAAGRVTCKLQCLGSMDLSMKQIGALQQYHRALLPLLLGTTCTKGGQADGAQPQNAGAAVEAGHASDDDSSSDEDSAELLVHDVDGLEDAAPAMQQTDVPCISAAKVAPDYEWAASSNGACYIFAPLTAEARRDGAAAATRIDQQAVQKVKRAEGGSLELAQLFGADVAQLQGGSALQDRAAALALASRMLPDCILTTSHTDGNPTAPNQRSYVCYGLHPTWTVSHAWPDAQYRTFADYFAKRYGIHGLSANCPLALARPLQHAAGSINVLLPPDSIRGSRQHGRAWLADHARDVAVLQGEEHPAVKRNHDGNGTEKEKLLSRWEGATGTRGSDWALLPLTLCKAHPVGLATLRDVRMLPALLRHTEGLLIAHELRATLFPPGASITQPPAAKLLEALTHRRCHDSVDSERYELLGDAVLKYVASCAVYEQFGGRLDAANEGMLTFEVARRVSNGTLFRAAHLSRFLQATNGKQTGTHNRQRGIPESLRVFPFALNQTWRPPGASSAAPQHRMKLPGKVAADAVEAIIGVLFEHAGVGAVQQWLSQLGLLQPSQQVQAASSTTFLTNVQQQAARSLRSQAHQTAQQLTGSRAGRLVPAKWYGGQDEHEDVAAARSVVHQEDSQADRAERAKAYHDKLAAKYSVAILQHTAVRGHFLKHHEVLLDMQNNKVGEIVRSALESPELQEHFKNCCPANEPPSRSQAQVEKIGAQIRKQLLASGALCEVEQQLQEAAKAQKQGAGRRVSWQPKDAVQQKQPQLDEIMGYCFRNQEWQAQALTHPCALAAIVGVHSYENLEFLGDAALGLVVTSYIFYCLGADHRQRIEPDQLHLLRSAIVKNDTLAFVAVRSGLHKHLQYESPSLLGEIQRFRKRVEDLIKEKSAHEETRNISDILYMVNGFGSGHLAALDHPKALGDVVEALIGATLLDTGFDLVATSKVVLRLLGNLDGVSPDTYPRDPYQLINTRTLKAGLGPTVIKIVNNSAADAPTSSVTTGAVAAGGNDSDTAASGSKAAVAATETAAEKAVRRTERAEQVAKGKYRGRAMLGRLWASQTCYGDSKRVVRVRCAQQMLKHLQHDAKWLDQVDRSTLELHSKGCKPSAQQRSQTWEQLQNQSSDVALDAAGDAERSKVPARLS